MGHHGSKEKSPMGSSASKNSIKSNRSMASSSSHSIDGDADSEQGETTHSSHGRKRSSKKKIPFFKNQSEEAQRRMEHLLYLAQECPDSNFDLSNCELAEVPASVYSTCKILNKETLLLNDNWLTGFDGSKSSDLKNVRVLDLHNNDIKLLPTQIGDLTKLQVLNLDGNKLQGLPESVTNMRHLQTLNLKGNRLKAFPGVICKLRSLRLLDISENSITELPKELWNLQTLESLVVDAQQMKFPPADVCSNGTEAMMVYICHDSGVDYVPPSNYLLNVLDSTPGVSPSTTNNSINKALAEEENLMKTIKEYNSQMEKKRQDKIDIEKHLEEELEKQTYLASLAQQRKQDLIHTVAEDQDKFDKELEELTLKKDLEKNRLLKDLQEMEDGANVLITKMLEWNEKAKKTEELIDLMEKDRIKRDELFVVRWEEIQNLRKQEVLNAMNHILLETESFENARQRFATDKEYVLQKALEDDEITAQGQVENILNQKGQENMMMLEILQRQDMLQREAFEALQLQKDAKHRRITEQINLIQEELVSISILEVEKRALKMEDEMNVIAEKRIALTELLSQLMSEQEKRQDELKRRLQEMEQERLDGQADYWLVQYQRLMDKKPDALINQEHQLEISVVNILTDAGASDYIPVFARHRITIETLQQITEEDLKQMGVHELGLRKAILRTLEHYRSMEDAKVPSGYDKKQPSKMPSKTKEEYSPPPSPAPSAPAAPALSRMASIQARGANTECVICMEKLTDTIFLNCGHVCTCTGCSGKINQCPLCREDIVTRIRLMAS